MLNLKRSFILSAFIVFIITGVAKLCSGLGSAKVLSMQDPILGICYRYLLVFIGSIEIVVAILCIFKQIEKFAIVIVAWLSTSFALYRLSLYWVNAHQPCHCLGVLTDAIHLSMDSADNIMKGVLTYLLIGSYTILFWQWRQYRRLTFAPAL